MFLIYFPWATVSIFCSVPNHVTMVSLPIQLFWGSGLCFNHFKLPSNLNQLQQPTLTTKPPSSYTSGPCVFPWHGGWNRLWPRHCWSRRIHHEWRVGHGGWRWMDRSKGDSPLEAMEKRSGAALKQWIQVDGVLPSCESFCGLQAPKYSKVFGWIWEFGMIDYAYIIFIPGTSW